MNDDRLVAYLAKYADSQETIQAVRKAIVGLAVAGRLDDRSPSQFTDTLDEFRGGLGHPSHTTGAKAKAKGLGSKFETTDLPHPSLAPDRFVRLGDIAKIEKGKTGIKQARSGPYPLVVTASDRGSCDHYDFDGAAAIVPLVSSTGHGKASLHRLHYQEGKFALGSILAAVFPKSLERISARFLFEYLSAFKEELLVSQMIGTANVSLSVKKISEVPVPIVSRMAQRTVDELMALCDTLEAEREKREATRDRLTTASLNRLTGSDVEDRQFKAHADFAIKVLPELTTRPDQIKVLRQTILDLAVRGKLVEQDLNDEPIETLLERLKAHKIEAEASRNKVKNKHLTNLDGQESPFDIPNHWRWVSIEMLADKITDGEHISPTKTQSGMPLLTASHVTDKGLILDSPQYVAWHDGEKFRLRCDPQRGDILICSRGTIGRCAIVAVDDVFCLMGSVIQVRLFRDCISSYVQAFLSTAFAQLRMGGMSGATAVRALYLKDIRLCPIPLPPAAEQRRIVAKIDELMMLCDGIERDCIYGEKTRGDLLGSLLFEALEPTNVEAT